MHASEVQISIPGATESRELLQGAGRRASPAAAPAGLPKHIRNCSSAALRRLYALGLVPATAMLDPQRAHRHMNKHRCHICSRSRCAGNAAKQKSLHALGLVPAAAMLDRSALTAKPADATASPYEAADARRKRSAASVADETLGEVVCMVFELLGFLPLRCASARQQTWRIEACRL